MALQAGMGVSRLVLIIGTGSVGTALYRNGKLSDVLEELQKLLSNEKGEDLKAQLQRITDEVKRASQSRPIVINGSSSGMDVSSLLLPAAAVCALGYGYMWWKGISFSDLMYVTKRGMATAVENLTKHLELVSDKLDAAKKHLTQRIENMDGKLDEQVEISKLIRSDVSDLRGGLSLINDEMYDVKNLVSGIGDRILTMEDKQELTNMGILYLCGVANEWAKGPERIQEHLKGVGKSVPSIMGLGLKELGLGLKELEMLESGNGMNRLITNGNSRGGMEKVNDLKPGSLPRMPSA